MEDIRAVNRYRPDFIGFIFDKTRRRYIPPEEAARLKAALDDGITAVGVFVNEECAQIARLAGAGIFDMIQLHGQETEQEIEWLKANTGKPVMKAVSVNTAADIARWEGSAADYLLFDSGAGGTGRTFDWSLVTGFRKPYFLAGGIHAGNIAQALKCSAYALDISGGAETDGVKDAEKISRLVEIVRAKGLNCNNMTG